jgi:diamine N-acetyltransferase
MSAVDRDAVARLFDELDVLHSDSLPGLFRRQIPSPRDQAFLQSLLETEQSAVLIADAGEVVGFVHVLLRTSPSFPIFVQQTRGVVESIYVAAAWRRRGFARELLRAAERWARERGAVGIDLNVYEFNEQARALFTAMGYSTLSRRLSKSVV